MQNNQTIAAIATAFGNAAVAIIRISGPKSLNILRSVFLSKEKNIIPRKMYFGKIIDSKNVVVDEVMTCFFKSPNSFTGEDSVEIYVHGGYINTQKILKLILKSGATIAKPGEFTQRAFLNGKIDLTQAEAIADIVYANSEKAQSIAQKQLEGILGNKIKESLNKIINVYAHISTQIDFPEEDVEEISNKEIINELKKSEDIIKNLINSAKTGKIYKNGVKVSIVGLPNAGKSSLLNALVKDKRAIVTDIPGTTRDVLESQIELSGVLIRLFDTAGITDTEDIVEKEGVKRSIKAIKDSEIVLFVIEKQKDIEKFLKHIKNTAKKEFLTKKIILIKNKEDKFKEKNINLPEFVKKIIKISAKTGKNIKELENILLNEVILEQNTENVFVTSQRQLLLLNKTLKNLQNSQKLAKNSEFQDKILIELDIAKENLGEILGQNISENILNKVFSRFCVGK